MYRIHEIKLWPGEDPALLPEKILKKLRARPGDGIPQWRIARRSIDARDKSAIRFVYSVDFEAPEKLIAAARARDIRVEEAPDNRYEVPRRDGRPESNDGDTQPCGTTRDTRPGRHRPVIAGFGPCGIFAALILAKAGLRPIVLERGKPADERALDVAKYWQTGVLNESSNVLFGEGGAGAFSDGKLTTGIGDARKAFVLETLAGAGGGADLLIDARPHIGTDVLRETVRNLRSEIEALGGEVRFGAQFTGFSAGADKTLAAVIHKDSSGNTVEIETDALVLAIGHSARDTYEMLLASGIEIVGKPFSIGLRIEHEQSFINAALYGPDRNDLPPAEYKLSTKLLDGRGVYTFCMCPGGEVVAAASEQGGVTSNGMSNHARSGAFANSAVLTDVRIEDFGSNHPLAGIKFQRLWERAAFQLAKQQDLPALLPTETLSEFYGS
ncbi:MAG: NAD(FAD)-utilizing dehydrogenase, partial [Clostridiales Family XIII bacterium]|nr:NAD(FAD)-utilizing dehydrogenase [Clostridiales Family XIII bacterium]